MVVTSRSVTEDVYAREWTTSFIYVLDPDDLAGDELSKPAKDELRELLKIPTGRARMSSDFRTSEDGKTNYASFTDREV